MRYLITLVLLGIALCAWCPWLEPDQAQKLIDQKITQLESTNQNICPIQTSPETLRKTFFGYSEKTSYDCTTTNNDFGVEKDQNVAFVTFYNGVIGVVSKILPTDQ